MKKWSDEEVHQILNDLKNNSIVDISLKYNRNPMTIYERLRYLKISNLNLINYDNWTVEEETYFKENYNKLPFKDLSIHLNREMSILQIKAKQLNLGRKVSSYSDFSKRKKPSKYVAPYNWNKEKIEYVKKNFSILRFKEMEEYLGISTKSIYKKAEELGLKRNGKKVLQGTFNKYELEILKLNYSELPMREMRKLIPNKTEEQINRKAHQLKLHKIKQTSPEEKVEQILKNYDIKYKQQVKFCFGDIYYLCDFVVNNIIIEVQGDYWHGNPLFYQILNDMQIRMIERDNNKKMLLEQKGYKILYLWEYDLVYNFEKCKEDILIHCSK